jgi:hypothetical protein
MNYRVEAGSCARRERLERRNDNINRSASATVSTNRQVEDEVSGRSRIKIAESRLLMHGVPCRV